MKIKFLPAYLTIFLIIIISLSISKNSSTDIRNSGSSYIFPLWQKVFTLKEYFNQKIDPKTSKRKNKKKSLNELLATNQLYKRENEKLRKIIRAQNNKQVDVQLNDENISYVAKAAIYCEVIFKPMSKWNSIVFVNAGRKGNEVITKNSPVMAGNYLVGVVEEAFDNYSKVRLITDPNLIISVRAVRGESIQNSVTQEMIETLLDRTKKDQNQDLITELHKFHDSLKTDEENSYLAKGELFGSQKPLGNVPVILKGKGFNFDFDDEKGQSRDLRSGQKFSLNSLADKSSSSILAVGDILVTTGMDGVFPADLKIAKVTKIESLKEGDYYYTLEAKPLSKQLEDLSAVIILPALGNFPEFEIQTSLL